MLSQVPQSYKFLDDNGNVQGLGRWVEKQRHSKKLGSLAPDRLAKLQDLVEQGNYIASILQLFSHVNCAGKFSWGIYDTTKKSSTWQDKVV